MTRSNAAIIGFVLGLPWVALLFSVYWMLIDTAQPMVIEYQHPAFLREPIEKRSDAKSLEVAEALPGQVVYVYREMCIKRIRQATIMPRWETSTIRYSQSDKDVVSSEVGCHVRNYPVEIPSLPTGFANYVASYRFELNPLRDSVIQADKIPVRIIAK